MDRVVFSDGLHPQSADLNAIGTFAEAGFDALLRALSTSETGSILFDSLAPVTTLFGTDVQISVPAQRFAVLGAVQVAPATDFSFDGSATDLWLAVYLVAGKDAENQAREFTSVNPTTSLIIQQELTTEIYRRDDPRIDVSTSTSLATAPDEPVLTDLDVGQVKLADIKYTLATGVITVTLNEAEAFELPAGVLGGVGAHASTHAIGGSDPLPVATTAGSSSTSGIMPVGSQYLVEQAIQSIAAATGAEFIEIATDAGRDATLSINLADSLDALDDDGTIRLGVNFRPKNAANGFEDRAARSDHQHTALSSGVLIQKSTVDVSAVLDSSFTVTFQPQTQNSLVVNPGQITNVAIYWLPPNQADPVSPKGVECGWGLIWESGANRSVGARSMITGPGTFIVEVGELAATVLTSSALTTVKTTPGHHHNTVEVFTPQRGSCKSLQQQYPQEVQ